MAKRRHLHEGDLESFEIRGSKSYAASSILTPPTLTATGNNYDPTGFRDADGNIQVTILRMSSNGGTDSITGIVPSTVPTYNVVKILNVGTFGNVRILNNSAGSLADNRFLLNANVTLAPNESGMFMYDVSSSRWRQICDYK